MMTHHSIRSSNVQVRTKPALRLCPRAFQNVVVDFLKNKNIPQVLEHGLRSNGQVALTTKVFYAWRRLAHLRSAFLYIAEGQPVVMIPAFAKEDSKAWTIRIPLNHRLAASVGPIICECYWDPMDHDLVINDVLYYNKELLWESHDYSERYQILHTIVNEVIQNTDDFSDCMVSVPPFEKLNVAGGWDDDSSFCAVFQPEDRGARRFRFVNGNVDRKPQGKRLQHDERPRRKQEDTSNRVTRQHIEILDDEDGDIISSISENENTTSECINHLADFFGALPAPSAIVTNLIKSKETLKQDVIKNMRTDTIVCLLELDVKNPLPDVYLLRREDGGDCGIAAVRSLAVSLEIRSELKNKKVLRVETVWYAPFKKWEVVRIL